VPVRGGEERLRREGRVEGVRGEGGQCQLLVEAELAQRPDLGVVPGPEARVRRRGREVRCRLHRCEL